MTGTKVRRNGLGSLKRRWAFLLAAGMHVCWVFFGVSPIGAAPPVYDVVIYGGTSSAVAAAVQVRRMDRSVILVAPDKHLGGLTSGGLGWTDTGRKEVIGGLAREFYQQVKKHYDNPKVWVYQNREQNQHYRADEDAIWVFEPHVAERTLEQWIDQYQIPVVREQWLDRDSGVSMQGNRIVAITTLCGNTYRGRMFLDATYEGDLMAAAGVSYHVGRESNEVYGETLNGVQLIPPNRPPCLGRTLPDAQRRGGPSGHFFAYEVSPYVVPDDPASGLLPRIHDGDPGRPGEGDHRIQAYNFRMCLTNHPENRVPHPKPEGYDPLQYELLLRTLLAGSRHVFGKFDPIPNAKTDTNNHGPFSTDNIGMNYDYPEASYERRREIIREHELYQRGYLYFLANDPRVPEDVREHFTTWGLAADEFIDNGHWPQQMYVREARRMVSDFVITENHLRRRLPTPRSVGMGSYNMDSHHTQRYVAYNEQGRAYAQNEGDVQVNPGGPYPIDYGALVPKQDECTNLLVPVCLAASHIAFGSIRMEPVFMILGQSAATAAVHALEQETDVQQIDFARLRQRLLDDGQVLEWDGPRRSASKSVWPADLEGVVVDDVQAQFEGQWPAASSIGPFVGFGYRHDDNAQQGTKRARFEAELKPGRWEVRLAYSAHGNRAGNVPVVVYHADGRTEIRVDQKQTPPIRQLLIPLGTFRFGDQPAVVELSNQGTDGHVIADAVQFVPDLR
jgi:hypothetical protein